MQISNTPGFHSYFIDSDIYKSYEKLKGTAFSSIYNMAFSGNIEARNALFYILYPPIHFIFYNFYVKNYMNPQMAITQGKDFEYLSKAYFYLFRVNEESIFTLFKINPEKSEESLINEIRKVCSNLLQKMVSEELKVSQSDTLNPSSFEFEDKVSFYDLKYKLNLNYFTDDENIQHAFIDFIQELKRNSEYDMYSLLIMRGMKYPDDAIEVQLKLNKGQFLTLLKQAKDKFKEFIGVK